MPIKFRCQQCRQFLGISRSKAGSVVDCPTCGRTIRVPDLDGSVKPLPKPSLDMQDSSLARALNELAAIGSEGEDDLDSPGNEDDFDHASVSDSDADIERFATSPPDDSAAESAEARKAMRFKPEVVELEPLPPPEPVELEPAAPKRREPPAASDNIEGDSSADHGWKSTKQGGDSWKRLLAAAELEGDSSIKPSQLMAEAAADQSPGTAPPANVSAPAPTTFRLAPSTWFAITGIVALIFAGGFWAGRITTVVPAPTDNSTVPTPPVDATDGNADPEATDTISETPAIRGRITWRTESGEVRPDVGARIIVLPVERSGSSRIPSAGVLNGSSDEDRKLSNAMIRGLGGDFQTTDDSGEFSVQLPNAGKFHLLVLSNALPRDDTVDTADVETVVSRYFDRPPAVLGRVQIHLDEVQYSGTSTTPWDFSFQRS